MAEDKLKESKVHKFKEEDRTIFAVSEAEDKPFILGFSGFGLSIIYDEQQLTTMEQLEEASKALANQIMQFVLEKTMGPEESVG